MSNVCKPSSLVTIYKSSGAPVCGSIVQSKKSFTTSSMSRAENVPVVEREELAIEWWSEGVVVRTFSWSLWGVVAVSVSRYDSNCCVCVFGSPVEAIKEYTSYSCSSINMYCVACACVAVLSHLSRQIYRTLSCLRLREFFFCARTPVRFGAFVRMRNKKNFLTLHHTYCTSFMFIFMSCLHLELLHL